MKRTTTLILLAALCIIAAPRGALADDGSGVNAPGGLFSDGPQERPHMISIMGLLPWDYGFGVGAAFRYTLPIVPDGFISKLNDSVELEFGADIFYSSYSFIGYSYSYVGVVVPVEGRWTFHITPNFSAYGKVGVGLHHAFSKYDSILDYGVFHWDVGPGILYKLGDKMFLRAEVGYDSARVGISMAL